MKSETISKIVKASDASAGELALVHFWGEDSNVFFETFYPGDVNMFGGANKASDHIDFVGCGKIGGIL